MELGCSEDTASAHGMPALPTDPPENPFHFYLNDFLFGCFCCIMGLHLMDSSSFFMCAHFKIAIVLVMLFFTECTLIKIFSLWLTWGTSVLSLPMSFYQSYIFKTQRQQWALLWTHLGKNQIQQNPLVLPFPEVCSVLASCALSGPWSSEAIRRLSLSPWPRQPTYQGLWLRPNLPAGELVGRGACQSWFPAACGRSPAEWWREGWRARGGTTVNCVPYSRQKWAVVAVSGPDGTVAAVCSQSDELRGDSWTDLRFSWRRQQRKFAPLCTLTSMCFGEKEQGFG